MPAQPPSIPAEALLQHRSFVHALARSLTRDEHAAEDVAQETWLEALRRPPRSAGSLRAWLASVTANRARNAARDSGRRVAREQAVARAELDESEESTRERVELQHRVVAAVLALPEPYRTVVLLRYDEGLEPAQIAARRGVPSGTIRSQLSRAHDILRQELDREFGGSRAAWLLPLAALGDARAVTMTGAKVAVAAAGVLVVAGAYVAFTAAPEIIPASENLVATHETSAEPEGATTLDVSERLETRTAVEQEATRMPSRAPTDADLQGSEVQDLLALGHQVQRELRERLLTPDLESPPVAALLAKVPDAQIARLIPYGHIEDDIDGRFLGIRGAGAYWSFATKSNDYDQQPDVHLSGNDLSARGYGGTTGWVLDLGPIDLASVVADPGIPPRRDALTRDVWALSWEDARISGREFDRDLEARVRSLKLPSSVPPVLGHTYLFRKIMPEEHDVLAVFAVIEGDEYGYTIAGRVLKRWPVQEVRNHAMTYPDVRLPEPPDWLQALDVPALLELSHQVRRAGSAKLSTVPEDLARRFPEDADDVDRGLARMLHRTRYDAITVGREEGAYFTFLTRSSVFDGSDDLCFEAERLSASRPGVLVDLGPIDFGPIERTGSIPRGGLSEDKRRICTLLEDLRHATDPEDVAARREFALPDEQRIKELRLAPVLRPIVGHTYLLRSVVLESHDVLVAFAVVESDVHGIWIRWRILATWPMDRVENR